MNKFVVGFNNGAGAVVDADCFDIDDGRLEFRKGVDLMAVFNDWAYVMPLEEDDLPTGDLPDNVTKLN